MSITRNVYLYGVQERLYRAGSLILPMADSRTFPKSGVTCCNETYCRCDVFGTHFGLEVGHGFPISLFIPGAPFCEETDGETAKHSQDPDPVTIADSTIVLVR